MQFSEIIFATLVGQYVIYAPLGFIEVPDRVQCTYLSVETCKDGECIRKPVQTDNFFVLDQKLLTVHSCKTGSTSCRPFAADVSNFQGRITYDFYPSEDSRVEIALSDDLTFVRQNYDGAGNVTGSTQGACEEVILPPAIHTSMQ